MEAEYHTVFTNIGAGAGAGKSGRRWRAGGARRAVLSRAVVNSVALPGTVLYCITRVDSLGRH